MHAKIQPLNKLFKKKTNFNLNWKSSIFGYYSCVVTMKLHHNKIVCYPWYTDSIITKPILHGISRLRYGSGYMNKQKSANKSCLTSWIITQRYDGLHCIVFKSVVCCKTPLVIPLYSQHSDVEGPQRRTYSLKPCRS